MEMQPLLQAFLAPDRLRILGHLAVRPATAAELAAELGLKPGEVARHLTTLRVVGLLDTRADRGYALSETALRNAAKQFRPAASPTPMLEQGEEWEQKVLKAFFAEGERLREVPTSLKRRLVIFKWLAAKFEPGRRYPEAEVNQLLKQHYPDFATLRRALVDYSFMDREGGTYWRVV